MDIKHKIKPINLLNKHLNVAYSDDHSQHLDNLSREKINRKNINSVILSEDLDKHKFDILSNFEAFDLLVKLKTLFEAIMVIEDIPKSTYHHISMKQALKKLILQQNPTHEKALELYKQLCELTDQDKNVRNTNFDHENFYE